MYHLFPTECMLDMPRVAWDIHTESHHWTSPDGIHNWTMRELAWVALRCAALRHGEAELGGAGQWGGRARRAAADSWRAAPS